MSTTLARASAASSSQCQDSSSAAWPRSLASAWDSSCQWQPPRRKSCLLAPRVRAAAQWQVDGMCKTWVQQELREAGGAWILGWRVRNTRGGGAARFGGTGTAVEHAGPGWSEARLPYTSFANA